MVMMSESETTLSTRRTLLKKLLPSNSFFEHEDSPQAVMTDDCTALWALQTVLPGASLILFAGNVEMAVEKEYCPLLLNGFVTDHCS